LFAFFKVIGCTSNNRRVVIEAAKTNIAFEAKQSAHASSLVVMIDAQAFRAGSVALAFADGANAALGR
jgi:hypothetical protein